MTEVGGVDLHRIKPPITTIMLVTRRSGQWYGDGDAAVDDADQNALGEAVDVYTYICSVLSPSLPSGVTNAYMTTQMQTTNPPPARDSG